MSHQKAIELVFNSNLLIMIVNQVKTANEILPGKIFEYVATGNPIIVIGPENGESAKLIKKVNQGEAFGYEKVDELKSYLIQRFKNRKIKRLDENRNEEFKRERITEKLSKILNVVVT